MAITVKDKPDLYAPSDNAIIWEFASVNYAMDLNGNTIVSPNNSIVYFEVKIFHESSLISTLKVYSTPDIRNGGYCNLSKILDSYVTTEFKTYNSAFIDLLTKPVFSYSLVVLEKNYNAASGLIVNGSTYISPTNYVFKAKLDKISFKYFNSVWYTLSNTITLPIKFLTTKPDKGKVNYQSEEALYFLNNNYVGNPFVIYKFYHKDGYQVAQHSQPLFGTSVNKMYKINISPAYLDTNVLNLNFEVVDRFEVYLLDVDTNTVLSEKRNFLYRDVPCHLQPINFYWSNEWGGIDSFQFYLSETNNSVTKTLIKTNPTKRDAFGKLREYDDATFNEPEKVIDISMQQTIKVNTLDLSDAEAKWLATIVNSNKILMKEGNHSYLPVTLVNTDYSIVKKKTVQGINMKEFSFRLTDGFDLDYRIV